MTSWNTHVVRINSCLSDGNSTRWPKANEGYTRIDDYYKVQLAKRWLQNQDAFNGNVTLDKLPAGYAAFEKPRAPGSKIRADKYVYGHPRGRFDSLVKFYDHFVHLMTHGNAHGCTCILCDPGAYAQNNSKRATRPADKQAADQEQQLKHEESFDPIVDDDDPQHFDHRNRMLSPLEPLRSVDFNAGDAERGDRYSLVAELAMQVAGLTEGDSLDQSIEAMAHQWPFAGARGSQHLVQADASPACPRLGEVVLYTTAKRAGAHWSAIGPWLSRGDLGVIYKAGIVVGTTKMSRSTLERSANAALMIRELLAGVLGEEETINVNDARRFTDAHRITSESPGVKLAQSVLEAMQLASSVMAYKPYWLKATVMPSSKEADIMVQGVYRRHELIAVGDVVAVHSAQKSDARHFLLWITKIKLHLTDVTAKACNARVRIVGVPLTDDPVQSHAGYAGAPAHELADILSRQLDTKLTLYHLIDEPERQRAQVSLSSISDRLDKYCFQRGLAQSATGSQHESGPFWADSRAQQLQLE